MKPATPLMLFSQYYLGVHPEKGYNFLNGNRLAAEMGLNLEDLFRLLKKNGLHPDTVLHTDFPLAQHQADLQMMAMDGVSVEILWERAESIYHAFLKHKGKKRDWLAEIEEEKQSRI